MINKIKIILLLILLYSCGDTTSSFSYVDIDPKGYDTRTPIMFDLELTDSHGDAEILICSRLNANYNLNSIPMKIELISPNGLKYQEEIALPIERDKKIYTSYGYDIEWVYRTNVVPKEYGKWKVIIFLSPKSNSNSVIKNIHGIGISTKYER
jgi:hypothetical protein